MTDSGSWMKLVSLRKPFHHHKIPFVVCWSQKAGCTTVFKWFLFHAGMLDEALAYIPQNPGKVRSIHKYEIEVFKARPGYTEELAEKLHGKYPVINFLRCPYERAFSSYMHIHNPKYIVYPNWKTPGLEMRHKILEDVYGDNFCTEYPLSFLDYLLWLKTQDMETLDPHHRPQYNPLFDAVPVNHFRLEDFAEAVSFLEKKYALASSLKSNAGILASGIMLTSKQCRKNLRWSS